MYRHRFCGCVRAVRRGVSTELHAHFTLTEGAAFSHRSVEDATEEGAEGDMRCPHELSQAHVAPWAKRPAAEGLFVEVDASRAMQLHARELVRVGVVPSPVRWGIDVGFNAGSTAYAIREHFDIEFVLSTGGVRIAASGTLDSWDVCERMGLIVLTAVMEDCLPELELPGMDLAERLVSYLDTGGPRDASESATALLSFTYGAVALLSMGVERRLLAYWACEFSRQTPGLEMFGVSVAQSLLSEMRYQGLMEPVFGPPLWKKCLKARGLKGKAMPIAMMAQNLLSYLTH